MQRGQGKAGSGIRKAEWVPRGVRGWSCLVAAFLVLGGPGAARAQTGGVAGAVRSAVGPLPQTDVLLRQDTALVARTATDAAGRFVFTRIPAGRYQVTGLALGYEGDPVPVEVVPGQVARVDVVLLARPVSVGAIRVEGRRERVAFEQDVGTTRLELAGSEIEQLPGLAEADVLRAVEVLPGVISTSDFSASFNVRGGAADQNLILLDGVPIYNPFHLGGVFGVFNADMVERTELLSGGFPARYGGRVSSVLNVRSDVGDGDLAVDAGVSLIASRAAIATGLPRETARSLGLQAVNARVSARRSYLDVLLRPVVEFPYHLTDFQGVAEAWTENGVWTVSGYSGTDLLDLRESDAVPLPLRLEWGNRVGGLGWAGTLRGVEVEGRVSSSSFETEILFPDYDDTRIGSRIAERRGRVDVGVPMGRATFGVGGEVARIEYENRFESGGTDFGGSGDEGWLGASYGQVAWQNEAWLVEVGARVDVWDAASADASVEPAPRVAVKRFVRDGHAAIKLAAGRYTQALHSLRDEEVPIGIDLWITAGRNVPVVVSDQVQLGWEQLVGEWSGRVEAYYRTFDGVVATNSADDPNDPSDNVLRGTGRSWGVDALIRRGMSRDNRVDGWIAISYLRAERTFPDPIAVEPRTVTYPPIFDRRWDVDLVLRFPVPGGIDGGLRFNLGSGLPYTRPAGAHTFYSYRIDDGLLVPQVGEDDEPQTAVILGDRNAERYPAYHRLDVSFRKDYRTSWGTVRPFLDLLNIYNRRDNVLFYFFDYEASPPTRSGISMLPFLPTLGAEVRF